MAEATASARVERSERVLDPIARTSEVLFGLIMALTFTGTLSAATAGRDEIRTLLIGMIGCNIAWGLVDAMMFLMTAFTERGHGLLTLRAVHSAGRPDEAHRVIRSAMPPILADLLTPVQLEPLRQGLLAMSSLPAKGLTRQDWLGALAVFLLVFLSTFPLVIPFLVFRNVHLALRVSNLIALVLLFMTGYRLANHGGYSPWRTGFGMMLIGVVLVAITIALGG
jgi:VIT family